MQAPEVGSMGENDGVQRRRMFRWPREARELVREYKQRTSRDRERNPTDRRWLVTKLVEVSGNPRDACLRFLRQRYRGNVTEPRSRLVIGVKLIVPTSVVEFCERRWSHRFPWPRRESSMRVVCNNSAHW